MLSPRVSALARFAALVPILGGVLVAGCPASSSEPPSCTTDAVDPATCSPLYPPTYENVYSTTIARTCGGNRAACHTPSGDGNMDLSTMDAAYASLLDGRVMPGNAMCSELVVRVTAVGADYQMPKGSPLTAPEQCAIAQWVEQGALGVAR